MHVLYDAPVLVSHVAATMVLTGRYGITPRHPGLPPPGSGLPLPHCARLGDGGPSLASSSSGEGVRSLAAGAGALWVERLGRTGEGGCCCAVGTCACRHKQRSGQYMY